MKPIIEVNSISKRFRLGTLGADSLREEVENLWNRLRTGTRAPTSAAADNAKDFWALRDVSFSVNKGEVLGIIGSNGAGKSTLLKILSRITEPTEGEALMRGRVASLLEVGTGFHPELSGRENIFLNGAILGMTRKEIHGKLDEIVEFSEIERFLDTPVKRYSSGMYVRLAFAVAAHLEPEILIVDEVLAVGDAAFQKKCLAKMGDVAKGGRTVLFVSHNSAAIVNLCSRCILIENGRLTADGEPHEVVNTYLSGDLAEVAVAEFEPGEGAAFFNRVALAREDRTLACSFDFHEPIRVLIHFTLRRAVPGIEVSFAISDASGELLFYSAPQMFNPSIEVEDAGIYSLAARIPQSILLPGRYFVEVALHRPNIEMFDKRDRVLLFEVTNTGFNYFSFAPQSIGQFFADIKWMKADDPEPAKLIAAQAKKNQPENSPPKPNPSRLEDPLSAT